MTEKKSVLIFLVSLVLFSLVVLTSALAFTSSECISDSDCGSGQICIITDYGDGLCASSCTTNSDCPSGEGCGDANGDGLSECIQCSDDGNNYGTYSEVTGIDPNGAYFSGEYCYSSTLLKTGSCGEYASTTNQTLFTAYYDCTSLGSNYVCSQGACIPGCTSDSDCGSSETCDTDSSSSTYGSCIASYCGIGDAPCSNGQDDDSDGFIDYAGACTIGTTTYSCSSLGTNEYDTDVSSGISPSCSNACASLSGFYTEGDISCVSPLDTSESDSGSAAPEAVPPESFWTKLWNWIIFWK